jgi:hypothetical protein
MSELQWLEEHSGQSTDELLALEGKFRTDSIVVAFESALDEKVSRTGLKNLTDEEWVILAVEALEREVNNGGYRQFFINSSCGFAPIIVEALNRAGCTQAAELTQRAIDTLNIQGPITVDSICLVMEDDDEERDDKLDACDKQYFAAVGDLSGPLLEFIKSNRDKVKLTE